MIPPEETEIRIELSLVELEQQWEGKLVDGGLRLRSLFRHYISYITWHFKRTEEEFLASLNVRAPGSSLPPPT